jgi:hypothetical protein
MAGNTGIPFAPGYASFTPVGVPTKPPLTPESFVTAAIVRAFNSAATSAPCLSSSVGSGAGFFTFGFFFDFEDASPPASAAFADNCVETE